MFFTLFLQIYQAQKCFKGYKKQAAVTQNYFVL